MREFDDEFDPIRIMKRFDKIFSNMHNTGFDNLRNNIREPLVDITENDKNLRIIAELPGMNKEDIDLRVKGNHLILKTEIKSSNESKEDKSIYSERTSQIYYRTIPLPEHVDPNQLNAKYNNGILEVLIPKTKKEKDVSRIKIH